MRADSAPDGRLGYGDGETTGAHVLGRRDEALGDRGADEGLDPSLEIEVERRRTVRGREAGERRVLRAGQPGCRTAQQQDDVARGSERRSDPALDVVEQADDA